MIFRQKCVCVVMFTVSILIVTGCGEFYNNRYEEGYDDGLRNGRIEGFDVGYEEGHKVGYNEGYETSKPPIVNPLPSSTPTFTIQDLFVYENIKMTERSRTKYGV